MAYAQMAFNFVCRGEFLVAKYDDGSVVRVLVFLCCSHLLVAGVDECCGDLVPLDGKFIPLAFTQVGEGLVKL